MAECNHVFVGKHDGVYCTKCNLHMSASEYIQYLDCKPKEEKPKRQTRKKVDADE